MTTWDEIDAQTSSPDPLGSINSSICRELVAYLVEVVLGDLSLSFTGI